MRIHRSVFHAVLKYLPWRAFDRAVAAHGGDARVRKLTCKQQLIALLYGQLAGACSLREIVAGLSSHAARLYHVGAQPARRSTLADANAHRPAAVFLDLLGAMMANVQASLARRVGEAVLLIDSTSLKLGEASRDWAHFSAHACGAKLHVVFDAGAPCPAYVSITPMRNHDISAAQTMPITPGATYVFDLGYYDYAWWASMADADCRIVSRLKTNTPLSVVQELAVAPGGPILSDRIGHLPLRQARNRRNPFSHPVREVRVRLHTGTILRIFSNDIDTPAEEIAALYKQRWAIELFFRWVKQTLKIRQFLGTSENAVRIQIAVALIAYLLLRAAHQVHQATTSPLTFARLIRANLMHLRDLADLLRPPKPNSRDLAQATFALP